MTHTETEKKIKTEEQAAEASRPLLSERRLQSTKRPNWHISAEPMGAAYDNCMVREN